MDFFEDTPEIKGGHCFVVMPFASEFDTVFTEIKDALQQEGIDLICERADEVVRGGQVMTDVLQGLAEAELVIVDLTRQNANVFYELGIAHTVRSAESVLLITQTVTDVPFDVQSFRCIVYDTQRPDSISQLQDKLVRMVKTEILPTRFLFKLSEGQTDKSGKVLGKDRSLYSFAICNVRVATDSTQFQLDVFRHHINRPDELVYSEVQKGLAPEESVQIPRIPYILKFDCVKDNMATFCVCRPNPSVA
jgi:hypothetical protein